MNKTALLVIDLQCGAFDGVRCPPLDQPQRLIHHAAQLLQSARKAGAPVIFIQHCEGEGHPFEQGTPHWELHQALAPQAGEPIVRKHESSAFESTKLAATLQCLGAQALVLCGLQSEMCVSNTARSALALGYAVTLAQDAHGTWPDNGEPAAVISERTNRHLAEAGAQLRSTQDLVQGFPT